MLMIIIVTSLVGIITLIISSVLYLISLICDQSDDTDDMDSLAIDMHDFGTSPATSPMALLSPKNCENQSHHHPCNDNGRASEHPAIVAPVTLSNNFGTKTKDDVSPKMKVDHQAPESHDAGQKQQQQPTADDQMSTWSTSATAQKTIITNQLGTPISKQLFEDFDQKEMQLGGTGLHWCKTRKSLDRLIKLGLPLNIVNKRQETALHVAVRKKKLPILIGLLCHGAEVDCKNENGETPLLLSCKLNEMFACQLLLIFDADVNLTDNNGQSCRHYAAAICNKHKVQQNKNQPNAAHLILAMLNEMAAKRCPEQSQHLHIDPSMVAKASSLFKCTDGCSYSGSYDGNSYNRWPDYQKESLYKRHMFSGIIEDMRKRKRTNTEQYNPKSVQSSRLFCIDGGGMRGVIVCQIMIEIEKYLTKPMISYFDWIGGTSAGAFLACALCAGTSLRELRHISFDVKDEVFSGNKPYNSKFLERVLKRTLGVSTRMSDIKGKKLAVTTVIADRDPCLLKLFKNYKSPAHLLESYGFAADMYDTMSSQSMVIRGQTSAAHNVKLQSSTSPTASSKIATYSKSNSPLSSSLSSSVLSSSGNKSNLRIGSSNTREGAKQTTSSLSRATTTAHMATNTHRALKQQPILPPIEDDDSTLVDDDDPKDGGKDSKTNQLSEGTIDESEQDPMLWQAVRASCAAPFFFKPYGPYLDGGIISNNPTLDMLSEFHSYERVKSFLGNKFYEGSSNYNNKDTDGADKNDLNVHEQPANELGLVVSLGTGRAPATGKQAMIDFGYVASGFATVFSPVELLRSIRAARDLFKKLMHRSCMTDDHVLDRAQAWCSSLNIPYFRINPPLANMFSIDDKRDEQLINALWQTKLYMRAVSPQLKQLAELLDGR